MNALRAHFMLPRLQMQRVTAVECGVGFWALTFARPQAQQGKTAYVGVTMSTMNATAESTSWLLTREQTEPEVRLDDAARIARAIAQLMDPEWREFVDEEQREKRRIASLTRSEP